MEFFLQNQIFSLDSSFLRKAIFETNVYQADSRWNSKLDFAKIAIPATANAILQVYFISVH